MPERMTDSIDVLHVDDDPDFADMAARFIERENDRITVETATRVSQGRELFETGEFDCIISDYDLPDQNGIKFLEAVRQDFPDIPFILYTGKGSEEVASEAISAGVTGYLQKEAGTSQYELLANRVTNAVEQYRSRQAVLETEEKLSQLAERTEDILFMFDSEWSELLFINSAYEEVWNRSIDELEGDPRSFLQNVHPEDRNLVEQTLDRILEGKPTQVEHRLKDEDGVRWIYSEAQPVFDGDGNFTRIVGFVRDITEHKERSRRFEAIFNNTYTFTGLLEPDGTVIEANDTALSFGGLERDDVVGKALWETYWAQYSEETRQTIREGVERARNGELFRDEIRVQGSDREAVIDFSIRPITDDRGQVDLLVPEGRDITERKEEQDKREQIIDRVTDAIVEVDSDWQFTLVNEQAENLYSISEADLLERDFWEVFAGARETRFEEEYRGVMETREPTSFVEYFSGLDGWFDIEAYPKDNGGIAFYFREVTDHVERSRELEEQQEQFRYVEDVADIGYWEIDTQTPEPHDVILSDGVYHIHELSPDESFDVEKGLGFYHPEDRQEVREAVEAAISGGEPYDHVVRIITDTGRKRWVHSVGEPVEQDGEIVKVRGAFQDITERKQKEQEVARQNDRLEKFSSTVSHDLRTPLNVIEGRLELLQEDYESEHFEPMDSAIDRMNRIIDDVLWLAREGQDIGSKEPVSLRTAVDSAWDIVADNADKARLRYTGEEDSLPTIEADQDRFRQLLENLLRNAIEHVGEDVIVRVGRLEDGFYVEDDGPGIPADERDQVLTAGYSNATDGTGFGLHIIAQVVEAHSWDIGVTDGSDGGARFEITGIEFADC
jgi:PAS domain S-box-containing protein